MIKTTEAYVEKAEKKSWHPIVWPHPERIAPEMNTTQKVNFCENSFNIL